MAWGITSDHIWEEGDDPKYKAVGTMEEHARIPIEAYVLGHESPELPGKPLPFIDFRLYDDDGELYFEGRLHDDDDCENQASALKWGESFAGCTTIKVNRQDGKGWVLEIG